MQQLGRNVDAAMSDMHERMQNAVDDVRFFSSRARARIASGGGMGPAGEGAVSRMLMYRCER